MIDCPLEFEYVPLNGGISVLLDNNVNTVDLYQISLVILSYILGNLQKIYCIPAIHCYFFVKLVCESGFSKGAKKGKKNIDCRL